MEKFCYKFYYNFYPDLQENNINTPQKLYTHYQQNGKNEERFPNKDYALKSYNFNHEIYRYNYSKLENLDDTCLENYFLFKGVKNNETKCSEPEIKFIKNRKFNVEAYRHNNVDLQNFNLNQLLNHFVTYGYKEKRIVEYKIQDIKNTNTFIDVNFDLENVKKKFNLSYLNDLQIQNYFLENIKNEELIKSNDLNMRKICILYHLGSWEVAEKIRVKYPKFFNNQNIKLLISYYEESNFDKINSTYKYEYLVNTNNQGSDIGGFFLCLDYLLSNKLDIEYDYFIFLHTKSDDKWREKMIDPIYNNLNKILVNLKIEKFPCLYSSKTNIITNFKKINYNVIKDVIDTYFYDTNFSNELQNIFYEYYPDNFYLEKHPDFNKINKFTCLDFEKKFYEKMELLDENHWYQYGIREFHRLSNYHYIKDYDKLGFNFVAGTIFLANRPFINIFKSIDIKHEKEKMEHRYNINNVEKRIHSWEYFFGLIIKLKAGNIYDLYTNDIIEIEKKYLLKKSEINIPFLRAPIAFFLLPISRDSEPNSGGYRTLLKYIKVLNDKNISCDIYLGLCWNQNDLNLNIYHTDEYGIPKCSNWLNDNISSYIDGIKNFGEIDTKKNNFYLGLKLQRNYKYLVANAWQVAEPVYKQKEMADEIIYIVQDLEYLFYPNDKEIQENVKKTYMPEYKYYFISKYLQNYFINNFNIQESISSTLCVNQNIYKNLNFCRENTVVIPYYGELKPGRNPKLVEEIIDILTENNIICYVYPYNYTNKNNKCIKNLGTLTINDLNSLYNRSKVGIIFSQTNPSRLGFEMYSSGLHVIEMDNEFTRYDMPSNYFTKIKDSNNIYSIVTKLFKKNINTSFLENINQEKDNKMFLKLFDNM